MIQRLGRLLTGRRRTWLIVGILLAVGALAWTSYRAITAWRESAMLLAERRADMAVDLLARALLQRVPHPPVARLAGDRSEDRVERSCLEPAGRVGQRRRDDIDPLSRHAVGGGDELAD